MPALSTFIKIQLKTENRCSKPWKEIQHVSPFLQIKRNSSENNEVSNCRNYFSNVGLISFVILNLSRDYHSTTKAIKWQEINLMTYKPRIYFMSEIGGCDFRLNYHQFLQSLKLKRSCVGFSQFSFVSRYNKSFLILKPVTKQFPKAIFPNKHVTNCILWCRNVFPIYTFFKFLWRKQKYEST